MPIINNNDYQKIVLYTIYATYLLEMCAIMLIDKYWILMSSH